MLDTGFMDLNPNVVKTPAYCVRLQSLDKNITTLAANLFICAGGRTIQKW